MKLRLRTLAVPVIGSMLFRVLVAALLTSISNAASLQPSETTEDPLDLKVITLDSQGNPAKTVYYSYDQLLTLPTVTVKTERDPNTKTPATYTGIYLSDLFDAFDADASFDVIGAKSSDGSKQYYDRDYFVRHRPILLLKFDDKVPADWPNTEHGTWLGPYCVVHESFSPAETIYGYVEEPRTASAVASLELTHFTQSLGRFTPKESGNDPEVVKGQKIAVGSCSSCHNIGNVGGQMGTPWAVLAATAVTSKDNFRKKVIDPSSLHVMSHMPSHPTFDDKTFNALEAYFKAMMPTE
jgi:mono/diheme cytochrome c family protein